MMLPKWGSDILMQLVDTYNLKNILTLLRSYQVTLVLIMPKKNDELRNVEYHDYSNVICLCVLYLKS